MTVCLAMKNLINMYIEMKHSSMQPTVSFRGTGQTVFIDLRVGWDHNCYLTEVLFKIQKTVAILYQYKM